jgi:hypothetical protein
MLSMAVCGENVAGFASCQLTPACCSAAGCYSLAKPL